MEDFVQSRATYIAYINIPNVLYLSKSKRPISLILSDLRFWVIHVVTISALFLAGGLLIISGLAFKLLGAPTLTQLFKGSNQIPILTDRYSALSEIEDV